MTLMFPVSPSFLLGHLPYFWKKDEVCGRMLQDVFLDWWVLIVVRCPYSSPGPSWGSPPPPPGQLTHSPIPSQVTPTPKVPPLSAFEGNLCPLQLCDLRLDTEALSLSVSTASWVAGVTQEQSLYSLVLCTSQSVSETRYLLIPSKLFWVKGGA